MSRFSSDYGYAHEIHNFPQQVDYAQLTVQRDTLDRIVFTSYRTVIAIATDGICYLDPTFYSMTTASKHKPKIRKIARRFGWEIVDKKPRL